jgi:hypothetical protein
VADSDEPHFDLTPSTEKAILWIPSLTERPFVGTESRLLMLIELLRQMSEGSATDPETRIAKLLERRAAIDREVARVREGAAPPLDDTALKDRFQQFTQLARELLTDFREVEQNFRSRPPRPRTHRIVGWLERRPARGDSGRTRRHSGIRSGQELSSVLGFSDVAPAAGRIERPAGADSRLAARIQDEP